MPAVPQDLQHVCVIPVMEHGLEQVGVTARRHSGEEISSHRVTPVGDACRHQMIRAASSDLRKIKEQSVQDGVGLEDRAQDGAVPAPDIDDEVHAGEVIGGRECGVPVVSPLPHVLIEDCCGLRGCSK